MACYKKNVDLSIELMMEIGHCKEFLSWRFEREPFADWSIG